jgi:hypothetical protein
VGVISFFEVKVRSGTYERGLIELPSSLIDGECRR